MQNRTMSRAAIAGALAGITYFELAALEQRRRR